MRRRLDRELVRRKLAENLEAATELIGSNRVLVNGAPTSKPERQVDTAESISLMAVRRRFVGRGGHKLEGAIDSFGLSFYGQRVLDAGASTGGFTDAALKHGAAEVLAVDVGRGQLHESLRRDPRVKVMDQTNLRLVGVAQLGQFDSVVADLSFISLSTVMENLIDCTHPGGRLVLLVKPQFEAARREAGQNRGVITDPSEWRQALERTAGSARSHGAELVGVAISPLRGASGNVEFFLHLLKPVPTPTSSGGPCSRQGSDAMIDAAMIDEAVAVAADGRSA